MAWIWEIHSTSLTLTSLYRGKISNTILIFFRHNDSRFLQRLFVSQPLNLARGD